MADQQSIELLAFNFASRAFADRTLAQGLSRSLSAFSSFFREYLDPLIKAEQCAQYVDDIGIAANNPEQLIKYLRAVLQCLRKAGLKLSMAKCHFWETRSRLPWTNDNNQGSSTTKAKDHQIPRKCQVPTFQGSSSKIHWTPEILSKLYT